jgi:hypothetical protein
MMRHMALVVMLAFAWGTIGSGAPRVRADSRAQAQQAPPAQANVMRYDIEALYDRLILAEPSRSKQFETELEAKGTIEVSGTVGAVSPGISGEVHVWLRHPVHGELIGRFRIPVEATKSVPPLAVGALAVLACVGVYRSYAQVSARSCTP